MLNELATEAGRDPTSIEVLAYIAPRERVALRALAEAGADAAAALAELDQLARQTL